MKKGLIIGAAIAGFGIAILNANQAERSDKYRSGSRRNKRCVA